MHINGAFVGAGKEHREIKDDDLLPPVLGKPK